MKLRRKPSSNGAVNMLLEQLQNASPQHRASGNQGNDQDSGGNGSGSASSGGTSGGTASGSVVTSGSVTTGGSGGLVRPNIAVAFQVEASDKQIFELENMTAVDDKGEPVQWMGPGPFNFYDRDFEKGLQAEVVGYFQEENATEHLTISGDLKVTPGRRIEVEFPNGKPSTKKSGEHSFQLKDVQSNANGIHVTISLPQLGERRGNNFGNPQKMMKAILEQEGAFEVMIVDTEGVLHSPGASASAGGSGSSSGSGGGSGTGGGSLGGASQAQSSRTFTFGGLPQGREIKSIVVRATEKTGKPQSYPFTLQNVPVPYVKD